MRMEPRTIQCKKYPIAYTLLIKKVKNINMRINENGEIVVSANAFVPLERIDEFVSAKIEWIRKHQQARLSQSQRVLLSEHQLMLFGKQYKIKYVQGNYEHVTYEDGIVHVILKKNSDKEKVIRRFLDRLCHDIFHDIADITRNMLADYDLKEPVIKVRMMKSRWGSCIPLKHQITLNKRLIHYPIEFIEYVILHEFVHFIQPNHSKAFYAIIENYMPDYKRRIQLAC
ncbi:MAG: M48 family metallopeptidase [Erysipelotrichaceae bacterium]|nr:M48 family metallopeptidase [Erysipelotrichaceae bacterium]